MPDQTNHSRTPDSHVKAGWLPFLVGGLLCTLVVLLWWTLDQREQANLHSKIKAEAEYLAEHMTDDVHNRIPYMRSIARRWEINRGTPEEEFVSDASTFLSDVAGVQSLVWADKNAIVRWTVPREGNAQAQNLNLASEEKQRIALEKAKATRSPTMAAPIDLIQGGRGFQVYFPVYVRSECEGFVVATFRIHEWLNHVMHLAEHHNLKNDFRISVFFDDTLVFKQAGWDELGKSGLGAMANNEILDHRFSVHILPTQTYIERGKTLLPDLAAVFGVLLSVLMAFIAYLLRKTFRDLTDRRQAEEILKQSEERVRLLLNSTGEAIYGIDLKGDCTFANPSCLRMLGYADTQQLLGGNMHRLIHHSYPDGSPMAMENCSIYQAFRKGSGIHRDDEVLWKADGSCFPAEYRSYPQIVNGEVVGAVVTFIDITERKQAEKALRESRQQFQALVETLYDWVWEVNTEGRYTYVSPQVKNILGYEPHEILGKTPFDLMPPEEARRLSEKFGELIRERKPIAALENINLHKDGHPVVLERNGLPFADADGNFKGYRGTDRDITVRKRAEAGLRLSEEKFSKAFQTSPYAIAISQLEDGKVLEVNDAFLSLTGFSRTEVVAESSIGLKLWVNEEDRKEVVSSLREGRPVFSREFLFRRKNGEVLTGLFSTQLIQLSQGLCMLSSIDDITDRKRAEEQIRHLATHDGLTDLPSMRLARDRLSSALGVARRHKTSVAVMFIDLDGFKAINDTLGHVAGDHILVQVAQRLLSCARETDTVARVGGDEFLLISTGLHTPENAAQIAEKVIHLVSQPIMINGRQAVVSASIGIALYPDHGEEIDQLIKEADDAMYRIKNTGKNEFGFATAETI